MTISIIVLSSFLLHCIADCLFHIICVLSLHDSQMLQKREWGRKRQQKEDRRAIVHNENRLMKQRANGKEKASVLFIFIPPSLTIKLKKERDTDKNAFIRKTCNSTTVFPRFVSVRFVLCFRVLHFLKDVIIGHYCNRFLYVITKRRPSLFLCFPIVFHHFCVYFHTPQPHLYSISKTPVLTIF